jgi:chromosome segregation ATPase
MLRGTLCQLLREEAQRLALARPLSPSLPPQDDDSYEAVLLEELSEMRDRFTEKIKKLTEQCAEAERRMKMSERLGAQNWDKEKASLEKRCQTLHQRCAQYEAELARK